MFKRFNRENRYRFNRFTRAFPPSMLIFVCLGVIEILYFQSRGLGNDFTVFYKAAVAVLEGNNPWLVGDDKLYSAYLNGPIATLLITFFGFFKYDYALLFARTLSVFLLPYIVRELSKFFLSTSFISRKHIYSTCSILLFTFPVRANLEYGQLFIIFLALFVAAISLLLKAEHSWKSLFMSGVLLEICIEYKPQVFLFYVLGILIKSRRVVPSIVLTGVFSGIVSSLLTRDIPFRTWLTGILDRSGGGVSTIDQMNIYALLSSGFLYTCLILGAFAIFCICQRNSFELSSDKNWKLVFSVIVISSLLNFYLHPTDLLLPVMFLVVAQWSNPDSVRLNVAIGFALVWSNTPLIVFLSITLVLLLMNNSSHIKKRIWIIFPNIVFILLILLDHKLETRLRQTFNFIAVVSIFRLPGFFKLQLMGESPECLRKLKSISEHFTSDKSRHF